MSGINDTMKIYLSTSRLSTACDEYRILSSSMNSWTLRLKNYDFTLNSNNSGAFQNAFSDKQVKFINGPFTELIDKTAVMHDNLEWTKIWANALLNRADDFVGLLDGGDVLQTDVYMGAATAQTELLVYDEIYCNQDSYAGDIKNNTEIIVENSDDEVTNLQGITDALSHVTTVSVNIDGDVTTINECIPKQKRVETVFESLKVYVTGVGVLNDHVRVNLGNVTAGGDFLREHFRPTDYTQGETENNPYLAKAVALERYVYGPDAKENLEAAMADYENLSDDEKAIVTMVYETCASVAAKSFDDENAEPYLAALETMTDAMITTDSKMRPDQTYVYDITLNTVVADEIMAGLDEDSDAYKMLAEFRENPLFTEADYKYYSTPDVHCDFSLDKAGINCSIAITTPVLFGSSTETVDGFYFTSQERSEAYINTMIDQDPHYGDHLMDDLGYSRSECAAMLTSADSTQDMAVLDALVNADDDYKNFFAVSCDGVTDNCQQTVSAYVVDILARSRNEQAAVNELNIFTNSLLNATDGETYFDNTEKYLELIAVGLGVQNSVDIENFASDVSNESYEKRLEASNTLFSLYSSLYCVYDEYADSDANAKFSDENGDLTIDFRFLPYSDGSYISNQKMSYSMDVVIENRFWDWNEDRQAYAGVFSYEREVGVYSTADANMEREAYALSQLSAKIEKEKAETSINAVISAVSIFQPEVGAAMKFGMGLLTAEDLPNGAYNGAKNAYSLGKAIYTADGKKVSNGISNTYSGVTTVADYLIKMHSISEKELKEYQKAHENMSTNLFYSYRRGTDGAVVCDPNIMKEMYNWDQNGCEYIYEGSQEGKDYDNAGVYQAVHSATNPDQYSGAVIDSLYNTLAADTPDAGWNYDMKVTQLENNSDYTMDQINDAMEVMIYGGNNPDHPLVNNQYGSVYDIPYDLVNACVKAIDDSNYEGLSLTNSWNGVVNTNNAG